MLLGKKGQEWLLKTSFTIWILVILYLTGTVVLANSFLKETKDTHNLEHYALFNRLLYSDNGIFDYNPDTDNIEFNIVNIEKINEDTLKSLFDEDSKTNVAFLIRIESSSIKKEAIYNPEFFNQVERMHEDNDEYHLLKVRLPIKIILNDNKIEDGFLTIFEGLNV